MPKKNKCRVCGDPSGRYLDCNKCWKFRERASQKYPQDKRGIKVVGFADVNEFARFLKLEYEKDPYCAYTRMEMMVEERRKKKRLSKEEAEEYSRNLHVLGFSIDRIDSKGFYERKNIALCINAINTMKGEFEDAEYIQACFQVLTSQVKRRTVFADQVITMLRKFYEQTVDLPVVPVEEEIMKIAGAYDEIELNLKNK